MLLVLHACLLRRNKSIYVTDPHKQNGIAGGQRYRKLKERLSAGTNGRIQLFRNPLPARLCTDFLNKT